MRVHVPVRCSTQDRLAALSMLFDGFSILGQLFLAVRFVQLLLLCAMGVAKLNIVNENATWSTTLAMWLTDAPC